MTGLLKDMRRGDSQWPCVIFAIALWWMMPAHAQQVVRDLPANAHLSTGEQGWACNRGFTQMAGLCVQDGETLSSQSAFEFYDGQWRCRPGSHRSGRICVPGVAPSHATYVEDGEHWQCDWGYRKVGSECQEIAAPTHGYNEASGHDWACYPGFVKKSDHCVPVTNPSRPGEAAIQSSP